MAQSRRRALFTFLPVAILRAQRQEPPDQDRRPPIPKDPSDDDAKLPNGKSQKDAIAKQEHEAAIREASDLVSIAQQLKQDLTKAGDYVVPVSSVRKTEEIERLAKRIRSRLKQ